MNLQHISLYITVLPKESDGGLVLEYLAPVRRS